MLKTFTIKFIPSAKHECKASNPECRKSIMSDKKGSDIHTAVFQLPNFHHAVVASNEVVARFSNIDYSTQESIRVVSISEKMKGL